MKTLILSVVLLSAVVWADSSRLVVNEVRPGGSNETITVEAILNAKKRIETLFLRMGTPKPGDWLSAHEESGQTFAEYIRSNPTRPAGRRKILYIQPIGAFSEKQRTIVNLTAGFMSRYFNLATVVREELPLSVIPKDAQRVHPEWGDKQLHAGYILDNVLKPRLPKDAAAYIAFTASDLWPGEGWNFVFGLASFADRVAVWSIYRNGNADGSPEEFRLCLLRTMRTATHETGHIFGMKHCIAYECNMCGVNNREEADRRPIQLCPECVAKMWWATGAKPVARYERLMSFCTEQGLKPESEFYKSLIERLKE